MSGSGQDQIVLLHTSDVHFGEVLLNAKTRLLSGYRCHHIKLCKALYTALAEVRVATELNDDDPIYVIMSGDLTSMGLPPEFHVGHVYFQHRLPDEYPDNHDDPIIDWTGLHVPLGRISMVPGNHDHWYGGWGYPLRSKWIWPLQRGYSPKLLPAHFRRTPWWTPIVSTQGGFQLDLFGIDSNSGQAYRLLNHNPTAGGSLSTPEFAELERQLDDCLAEPAVSDSVSMRARAIICHHALLPDGVAKPLDKVWTTKLVRAAASRGVAAILTGHTHRQYPFRFGPPRLQLPNSVWEIRCPRTLQGPAQRKKGALAPGFWVHQIRPVNGKLNWAARLFVFDSGRFMWGRKADPWFAFDCP